MDNDTTNILFLYSNLVSSAIWLIEDFSHGPTPCIHFKILVHPLKKYIYFPNFLLSSPKHK